MRQMRQLDSTRRRTRAWAKAVLVDEPSAERVLVRDGAFADTVVDAAIEIGAGLIVIPPAEGQDGAVVTKICAQAEIPVLVARMPMSRDALVAATNLKDVRYPVLTRATEIASRLGVGVLAVHNVAPRDAEGREPLATTKEVDRRRRQLATLASEMDADIEPVVVSWSSAAEAIIAAARERDADVVVVGTRAGVEDLAGTAAEVIGSTYRSVLVVPLREGEPV